VQTDVTEFIESLKQHKLLHGDGPVRRP
jgi:hypothetical protein